MKYLKIILTMVVVMSSSGAVKAQDDCRKSLQDYMNEFPQSDLCDVYKFCFQDVFGPAHLSIDSVSALKHIEAEVEKTKIFGGPDYQYTGCEGNYVRVNLKLVKNGELSAAKLVGCLCKSVNPPKPMTIEEWKYRWSQLENILVKMKPAPGHFTLDSESIESLLERGGYTVHHSYSFNSTYNFHYRIVRKDVFEAEILPLFSKKKQ